MRKLFLSSVLIFAAFQSAFAQTPVLGSYSSVMLSAASSDTVVVPSVIPSNVGSATATTTVSFKGQYKH